MVTRLYIDKPDVANGIYYEITPIRRVYLDFIAACEGTDKQLNLTPVGYDILYGGSKFTDLSKHPNKRIKAGAYTSSASGRYQVMDFTEKDILKVLKFGTSGNSFMPEYQDQRCLYLIDGKRKAIKDVDKDNFKAFCEKCSWEWASILPSRYGQGYLTLSTMTKIYTDLKKLHGFK